MFLLFLSLCVGNTVWFDHLTAQEQKPDEKNEQDLIKTIRTKLPGLRGIYSTCCLKRAMSITREPFIQHMVLLHHWPPFAQPRYRSSSTHPSFRDSFFPQDRQIYFFVFLRKPHYMEHYARLHSTVFFIFRFALHLCISSLFLHYPLHAIYCYYYYKS